MGATEATNVDQGEAERFLSLLDAETDFFTFQTFDDSKRKDAHLARVLHGTLAEHVGTLTTLGDRGAGVYVTVNATDGKKRTGANIVRVRAVFADFDPPTTKPLPESFSLEPHIIVESSRGRHHAYWLVDDLPLEDFTPVQKAIAERYGSDKSVSDLPRVMRLPGFLHRKGAPYLSRIIHESGGLPFTADAIREAFPPVAEPACAPVPAVAGVDSLDPDTWRELRSALFFLCADDRGDWIANGQRLHSLGEPGRALWWAWSQTSSKCLPGDFKQWDTFTGDRTGYKAVFAEAQRRGWQNPMASAAPQAAAPGPAPAAGTEGVRYKLLSVADLEAMPPIEWRIKHVLPARGLAQIYGPSASGKSFLTFDLCAAIAEGRESWFGYRVTQAPVVYVALEGEAGFKLRAQAWTQHQGRDLPEHLKFVMQPWHVNSPGEVAALAHIIPAGAVVIVDTQNRAAPHVDENSVQDMGQVIEGSKRLQEACGGLVVLLTHTGHSATGRPRGSSVQTAAMDAGIEVTRDKDYREWITRKVKDGQDGGRHGFRLEVVELGKDGDGDGVTSCVVLPDGQEVARPRKRTRSQAAGIEAYRAACSRGLGRLDSVGQFAGLHLDDWRTVFYEQSTADNVDTKRRQFTRSRRELQQAGLIEVAHDVYRVTDQGVCIFQKQYTDAAKQRDKTGFSDVVGQVAA